MTEPMTLEEMRDLSPYVLADMAQCESPDSLSSPGAEFLDSVRDEVACAIDDGRITLDDFDDNGQLHAIVDEAPSFMNHERWEQFTDLGAYNEEPEFDDSWPNDLTQAAGVALYQIADRLARTLCEAWRAGWTCPVCGAEVDEGCTDTDGCDNPAGALISLVRERLDDVAKASEVPAEPLPVRTPGKALAEALAGCAGGTEGPLTEVAETTVSAEFTGPVKLPPVNDPILALIDQADAADMGIRVTRAAMAHDRAVSRFRRWVWTVAGVLAVVIVGLVVILT